MLIRFVAQQPQEAMSVVRGVRNRQRGKRGQCERHADDG